jgi:hypothetical protein
MAPPAPRDSSTQSADGIQSDSQLRIGEGRREGDCRPRGEREERRTALVSDHRADDDTKVGGTVDGEVAEGAWSSTRADDVPGKLEGLEKSEGEHTRKQTGELPRQRRR